jgi:hypothetical protein
MNTTCPGGPGDARLNDGVANTSSEPFSEGRSDFVGTCSQMAIELAESDVIKAAAYRFGIYDI